MINFINIDTSSVEFTIELVDAYGNSIETLDGNPCSYYKHDKILYTVGLSIDEGNSKHDIQQVITTSYVEGLLTFQLSVTNPLPDTSYTLVYNMYQGLLVEDGLDLKFYTTDNFQQHDVMFGDGFGTPQVITRI